MFVIIIKIKIIKSKIDTFHKAVEKNDYNACKFLHKVELKNLKDANNLFELDIILSKRKVILLFKHIYFFLFFFF